jgi:fructuronate reductase
VHLGVGAFHRAHMAAYVDDLLGIDPSWGIVGASLRRPDARAALSPQDCLYTLVVRSAAGTSLRTIGSILDVLKATEQRSELISAMADPRVRIVSLTVTEKGYCHDPATGELDAGHPDIRHDLEYPALPVSAPGLILRALVLRREAGAPPFTVMSCDNLPENGKTVARVVTTLAALHDKDLADQIANEVAFPCTMVDRIVPATTDKDRRLVCEKAGYFDMWPVATEPFTQWVVEDNFPTGRPLFETVGVQLVDNVRPFELMKLRMLNGSHSTLAYLGFLAGYEFVNEAIADGAFAALIYRLMTEEVMGTLPDGLGDLAEYRDALLERFSNPALEHKTWQIAMDGSQKLPQRLLGTIRERLAAGKSIRLSSLGVAGWIRYACGVDEKGRKIEVMDPLSERMRGIALEAGYKPKKLVEGFLDLGEVFGNDLPTSHHFRATLGDHIDSLFRLGTLETVRSVARLS